MHEPLPVVGPAHLGRAGDPAGELVGRAVGDDPPAGQHQDPVGELLRLVEVVRGEQDGGLLVVGQPVHQVVEFPPGFRVEARGRLVQEQHLRAADDADGDVDAAALAAGQVVDLAGRLLGEAHRLDEFVGVPRPLDAIGAVRRIEGAQVIQ
nr:hypothetical protein [Nocardia colli]